jgi:hypothetical protein
MKVENHKIVSRMKSWTSTEWEGIRENYAEYRGSLGPEATKTFKQFAFGIAAQNELYAMLQEAK